MVKGAPLDHKKGGGRESKAYISPRLDRYTCIHSKLLGMSVGTYLAKWKGFILLYIALGGFIWGSHIIYSSKNIRLCGIYIDFLTIVCFGR